MSFPAQYCSRVSSVGCVKLSRCDQHDASCASSAEGYITIVVASSIEFFPNYLQLLLALLAVNHLVHFFEGLEESLFKFLLFVQF